jgi:predicted adenine nucleotide alpha hydrolase (AANH) superfamily ATPase
LCFEYRFHRAVKFAHENGYNAIASVLGVSRHKSQSQVDISAQNVCDDIQYMPITWDENLRVQTNRESDFYRQNYCGCEFSIRKM